MLMNDEVVIGSVREAWLYFHLFFKFGERFSDFSGEDEWSEIVKRCCIRLYSGTQATMLLRYIEHDKNEDDIQLYPQMFVQKDGCFDVQHIFDS